MQTNNLQAKEFKKPLEQSILVLFFGIGIIEIIAEYFNEVTIIYVLKPLLAPILGVLYYVVSNKRNGYFLVALFFVFLANIFFISKDFSSILIASVFFLIYRAIVIYLVIKNVTIKSFLPVLIGSIPFVSAFTYLTYLTMDELGNGFYIYLIQIIFLSFLGGFSLSNYMIDNNNRNYFLLVHSVCFAIIQFVLAIKLFYLSIQIFQPISMFFYVFGQFALYKFIIIAENYNQQTKAQI